MTYFAIHIKSSYATPKKDLSPYANNISVTPFPKLFPNIFPTLLKIFLPPHPKMFLSSHFCVCIPQKFLTLVDFAWIVTHLKSPMIMPSKWIK